MRNRFLTRPRSAWAFPRCPAACAPRVESSPARTVTATSSANFLALPAPLQSIMDNASDCAGSFVPPPTVPISTAGMRTEMYRSPSTSSHTVIVEDASTTCAGSCPVARYRAATMLAAWALNPSPPAMALPMRFLRVFVSTIAWTGACSFSSASCLGIVASAMTVFPRPSIMLMAAGFLSVHILPETETISAPVFSAISLHTASDAMVAMFIPMASPVSKENLR